MKVLNIPNFHIIRQKTSIVPGNTLRQCIAGDFISTAALRQTDIPRQILSQEHTYYMAGITGSHNRQYNLKIPQRLLISPLPSNVRVR